jgi:hypothetical protein
MPIDLPGIFMAYRLSRVMREQNRDVKEGPTELLEKDRLDAKAA